MTQKLFITPINGYGDKIINVLGALVYSYYKKYDLKVCINADFLHYQFGTDNFYDLALFNYNEIDVYDNKDHYKRIHPDENENYLTFINPDGIVSITPFCVYQKLKNENINVTFEEVSELFLKFAKNIQPSEIVSKYIPDGIEKAYGIHLRKTDKIKENPDVRHEMSPQENSVLMENLFHTIRNIIENDENPSFYVTSEDFNHENNFIEYIKNIANEKQKPVTILKIDDNIPESAKSIFNFYDILDFFSLSKCKVIIQGVKYSAFSIVASLVGNETITNLSGSLENDHLCIIKLWNSVLKINNVKRLDEEFHANLLEKYKQLGIFYGEFYVA
jgi:hypothetical protein